MESLNVKVLDLELNKSKTAHHVPALETVWFFGSSNYFSLKHLRYWYREAKHRKSSWSVARALRSLPPNKCSTSLLADKDIGQSRLRQSSSSTINPHKVSYQFYPCSFRCTRST